MQERLLAGMMMVAAWFLRELLVTVALVRQRTRATEEDPFPRVNRASGWLSGKQRLESLVHRNHLALQLGQGELCLARGWRRTAAPGAG